MSVPLSVAAPLAAASIAYLNARWSASSDIRLLKALIKSSLQAKRRERDDRVNLFYVLESWATSKDHADHIFLIYEGRQWTYKEFYSTALKYGTYLKQTYDVKPGDVVAMVFINSPNFLFIWFGLWIIGAVPAFINYNLTGSPLVHSIKTSTARLVIVEEEFKESFSTDVIDQISTSPEMKNGGGTAIIYFTPQIEACIMQTNGIRHQDDLRIGVKLTDPSILIFTSGTTGHPKAAIVSWNKPNMGGKYTEFFIGLQPSDRFYTCMPLYHSSATILGVCTVLNARATIVIGRRFSTKTFWPEIRQSNATIMQYVGETCRYLLAAPPQIDLVTGDNLDKSHNLRIAFGNGLRPDIWNRFRDRFDIETICEFYAATESTSASWNFSSNDFTAGAIGKHGPLLRFIAGTHVGTHRIVKIDWEKQEPLRDPKTGLCIVAADNEPGELLCRVDENDISQKFQGYFNNQKASMDKILRDVLVKGDAWFRSGDLIMWDQEGRSYFKDRLGDTFRWKSENVSTSEVSEVLGVHPLVQEANVYGISIPHHDGQAGCVAIAMSKEPTSDTMHSLAKHVLKNLPRYAIPLFLRFPSVTRSTGTNKQQKHDLRQEGIDPSKTQGDLVFWLKNGTYQPFKESQWQELNGGKVHL